MARDVFISLNRCSYCGRPGFIPWDTDLSSCGSEVCEALAFAEVRRRHANGGPAAPEQRLAKAILSALDTFEYELRRDRDAELIDPDEARRIDRRERSETARLLSQLRELERRYPPPPEPPPPPPDPHYRRFVSRGRTVGLRRDRARARARA